MDLFSKATTV